jgi:putative ABC transport system permease protein
MSWWQLIAAQMWQRRGQHALSLLLIVLASGVIAASMQFVQAIQNTLVRDAQAVDLVVGAKGSGLQLMLAALYHVDVSPGNIKLKALDEVRQQRFVKQVVPVSIGDTHQGFRIVGTTAAFAGLYGLELAQGRWFSAPMQAVVGAQVARQFQWPLGAQFLGYHGLGQTGTVHEDQRYEVVGLLKPTGTVVDRLILTPLESVWLVHEGQPADAQEARDLLEEREVSAALVQYASPLAAAIVPRAINASDTLQAASPAVESARLMQLLEPATRLVQVIGLAVGVAAMASIFLALMQAAAQRRHEFAVMRLMGASVAQVFGLVWIESALLGLLGGVAGVVLSQALLWAASVWFSHPGSWAVETALWQPMYAWLLAAVIGLSGMAALWPAWRAARVDVAHELSQEG